jgi:hypothetical protein
MSLIAASAYDGHAPFIAIEAGITIVAVAIAFAWPTLGYKWFCLVESVFARLARKKGLAVLVVGVTAVGLRLLILPFSPIPHPFIHDDFSFLLAADTFSHGRLTNPTPVMWTHFESFHIDMKPTYMSMYFPAQGLVLAAGKVVFGNPWFGLLIATALMCAAICWMLQAWLPPTWALLGGMFAIVHLGLFSYWIDTYAGAGSIAALGGALVLGGLPRFLKGLRIHHAMLMALGVAFLANTRPFEGMLLCLVVAGYLCLYFLKGKNQASLSRAVLHSVPALGLLLVMCAGMGYYNYRVFGSPLTLPYTINRATYGVAPYFIWQSPRPVPVYRNEQMRAVYTSEELGIYKKVHSASLYPLYFFYRIFALARFFAGLSLLPVLLMLRAVFHDRRVRFLFVFVYVSLAAIGIQVFLVTHYLAPFTAAYYAIGLQCARHLRQWKWRGLPIGQALIRFTVSACLLLVCVRPFASYLNLGIGDRGSVVWSWFGTDDFGGRRADVQEALERQPGQQIAIVRYSKDHQPDDEWVYNCADIDASKVIWARELDPASNRALFQYYRRRNFWLVKPDSEKAMVTPYPAEAR